MNFNNINEYSEYYASQLILQYISKPKARGTIKSLAECLFVNFANIGIWRNLNKADGDALLAIAEMFGISGYFDGLNFNIKYFATEAHSQGGALTPVQEGFQSYSHPKDGVFLDYSSIRERSVLASVSAKNLRGIIRIKALNILGIFSPKYIQEILDLHFQGSYISESYAPPMVTYSVPRVYNLIFSVLNQKKYLLRPPGVGVSVVILED